MRLVEISRLDDVAALRPGKGDTVEDAQGNRYTVEQVGMKYFVLAPLDNPRMEVWVKHREVAKVLPSIPPAEDAYNLKHEYEGLTRQRWTLSPEAAPHER